MTAAIRPTGHTSAPAASVPATAATDTTRSKAVRYTLAGLRLSLGWVFLWAFIE